MDNCPLGRGGNEAADDNIFLQSDQYINFTHDRRFGEYVGRILKRCGRKPWVRMEWRLTYTKNDHFTRGWLAALCQNAAIFFFKAHPVNHFTDQKRAVTRVFNADFIAHFTNNDFKMLIIDGDALRFVNTLFCPKIDIRTLRQTIFAENVNMLG